jgi:hypothetical protein
MQTYSNTSSAEQHMNIQHDVIPVTSRMGNIKLLSKWYTHQFIFMNSVTGYNNGRNEVLLSVYRVKYMVSVNWPMWDFTAL